MGAKRKPCSRFFKELFTIAYVSVAVANSGYNAFIFWLRIGSELFLFVSKIISILSYLWTWIEKRQPRHGIFFQGFVVSGDWSTTRRLHIVVSSRSPSRLRIDDTFYINFSFFNI